MSCFSRQVFLYYFRFGRSDFCGQFVERSFPDTFYAFKPFEQLGFGFLADAFDGVQCRNGQVFAAFVAMESDGKTVHFILYLGHEPEHRAVCLHANDDRREAEQQFVGAMAVVFSQSGDGDAQSEFVFHHFAYHLHLSPSAVRDDEVGQFALFRHGA